MEILASSVIQRSMKEIGDACRADWAKLGNAHVLLTGGTGFFGSWMIVSFVVLRRLGFPIEMTVLSRDPEKFLGKNPSLRNFDGLTFRKGDVNDATIPFSITHVFHFATTSGKAEGSDHDGQVHGTGDGEIRRVVVEGTRHMLAEAKRVGAVRFLFGSSGAVYGRSADGACNDNSDETVLRPDAQLTPYGAAKRDAERLCQDVSIAREIETVIARGFTFCGPLFPIEGPYVISTFLSAIFNGVPLHVKTPNSIRSFLDGRDLVTVLWRLLASGKNGEAYNVGSDETVSMNELADLMRAVAWKVSQRIPDVKTSQVMQGSDIYRPSILKLQNQFGWKPSISLRESLLAQAQWAAEARSAHADSTAGSTRQDADSVDKP